MESPSPERELLGARLTAAVAEREAVSGPLATPLMVVDLDAFDANASDLHRRAGSLPVRVASKSLRVPALISRALAHEGFTGVLAYTLAEGLWLHGQDISGDVLVAYPSTDRAAIATLLASPGALASVTVMIDDLAHLDLVDVVRAPGQDAAEVRVAIEVDAGLQLPGGGRLGPRRSPLRGVSDVMALAREVVRRPGFRLVGVMTYEGQVAGLPDRVPGHPARSAVVRRFKALSLSQLLERRHPIAVALGEIADLEFWNSGGSGSVQLTAEDPVVTEIAAGSGLMVPALFDHYDSFTPLPAAFFALPVTRRPGPKVVTVHGGGLSASGPAGTDRLPTPWVPAGLELTATEAAGEVQTPLTGKAADRLAIGDLVWFRHAKSGELFEHTTTVHLLSGSSFVDTVATYRGHGLAF